MTRSTLFRELASRALLIGAPLWCLPVVHAQKADRASSSAEGRRCSNSTLNGAYAFAIEGVFVDAPSPLPLRGVALTRFDGLGHVTQVDHVVFNGTPPPVDWTPATGWYRINADCTGEMELDIPRLTIYTSDPSPLRWGQWHSHQHRRVEAWLRSEQYPVPRSTRTRTIGINSAPTAGRRWNASFARLLVRFAASATGKSISLRFSLPASRVRRRHHQIVGDVRANVLERLIAKTAYAWYAWLSRNPRIASAFGKRITATDRAVRRGHPRPSPAGDRG